MLPRPASRPPPDFFGFEPGLSVFRSHVESIKNSTRRTGESFADLAANPFAYLEDTPVDGTGYLLRLR
jgi:hypothetical protein